MGDTKAKVTRSLWITRIILAAVVFVTGVIASVQLILFPQITIKFDTGADAQPIKNMQIKRGSSVELPVPLKPGSYFIGWSLDRNSGDILEDSKTLTADGTTLYAVWDGVEKYGVLMVNGVVYKDINIFDISNIGLTPEGLNRDWRLLDDYSPENTERTIIVDRGNGNVVMADKRNNYQRFLGWRYLNAEGQYNDILCDNGAWTWIKRDARGNVEEEIEIDEEHKFYPPNYRTTFNALLEYRKINFQLYERGANTPYSSIIVDANATNITIPTYNVNDPSNKFSHWQIEVVDNSDNHRATLADYATQEMLDRITTRRFASGEIVDVDPLWYYLGTDLITENRTSTNCVVNIALRATDWTDEEVDKYTMQTITDTDLGHTAVTIPQASYDDLSLIQPIVYTVNPLNPNDKALWLYWNKDILSYSFYDHNGTYHEISTTEITANTKIPLGTESIIGDKTITLNPDWAVNIKVKYQKALTDITLRFDFGPNLYLLPSYRFNQNAIVQEYTRNVGNDFTLLSAEKYLKSDHLFYGWRMKGDPTGKIYNSGATFTIPAMDTAVNRLIEFEAVWRMSRLLFDFDFNGGAWAETPNYNPMKGAYNDRVQIITEAPVRFGYDFLGWTLDQNETILQPGDYIVIGTEIRTLHAHWLEKKLRLIFYTKTSNSEQWQPDPIYNFDANTNHYRIGDTLDLPTNVENSYYKFLGWEIGDQLLNPNLPQEQTLLLSANVIEKLQHKIVGDLIQVDIYARQERVVTEIVFDFSGVELQPDQSNWVKGITQGELFAGAPFNLPERELNMEGREFQGWEYAVIKHVNNKDIVESVRTGIRLGETIVPYGVKKLVVYPTWSKQKTYTIEYYDFSAEQTPNLIHTDPIHYNYRGTPLLLPLNQTGLKPSDPAWGTLIGWSVEPDFANGNPEIIYNILDRDDMRLQLSNVNQTICSASDPFYRVKIDQFDEKEKGVFTDGELHYRLKLYAVYAKDYVIVTYNYYNNLKTQFYTPVFIGNDYEHSVMGGVTVGPDDPMFEQYGLSVLDDADYLPINDRNFVGWKINPEDLFGVRKSMADYLGNKIWFPGEQLPAVDFDLTFTPIIVPYGNSEVTVGNRTYRVKALTKNQVQIPQTIVGVDILVFPNTDSGYKIPQNTFRIVHDQPVHVVVPAEKNSAIEIEPMAIQCDQITEFYVGDNVFTGTAGAISGSPITGANFQTYRVKKGYRTFDLETKAISDIQQRTTKYNYVASLHGLLIRNNQLLAVPSHTNVDLTGLLNQFGINQIVGYALSEMRGMNQINLNLATEDLSLDAKALFGSDAREIILPVASNGVISPECLSGNHSKLFYVKFGNESYSNYAFVEDDGFVYYDATNSHNKSYLMYALQSAQTHRLNQYLLNFYDLRLDDEVETINPYAFAGRDWSQVNSLTALNPAINLSVILGLPTNIPLFVSLENPYRGGMVQPYEKILVFNCDNFEQQVLHYVYGQTFTVFDPKDNNPHNFKFDRSWCKFLGWTQDADQSKRLFKVGEVYRVGIDDVLIGDGYEIRFNANSNISWQSYMVQFHIYNGQDDLEYQPTTLLDYEGNKHTMQELIGDQGKALVSSLYLPGLDVYFTGVDGFKYQFIGWGTTAPVTFSDHIWSNYNANQRLLPTKTIAATIDKGAPIKDNGQIVYNFYALYDAATDNLSYTLEGDTYTVRQNTNARPTSIRIPFAKYLDGYMVPITKVANRGFSSLPNVTEIVIGGGINEIGTAAFENLNAKVTFAHKGKVITYTGRPSAQLRIGARAFLGNRSTNFDVLVLPAALTEIGESAFESCTNLQHVYFEGYEDKKPIEHSLNRIENFAFRNDNNLYENKIIDDIAAATTNNKIFFTIGEGIFMGTQAQIYGAHRIDWVDTLVHAYDSNTSEFVVTEKTVLGYAFAGLNGVTSNKTVTSIRFDNMNTEIHSNAFTYMSSDITLINLININPEKVSLDAFNSVTHDIYVRVGDLSRWSKFNKLPSNIHLI